MTPPRFPPGTRVFVGAGFMGKGAEATVVRYQPEERRQYVVRYDNGDEVEVFERDLTLAENRE